LVVGAMFKNLCQLPMFLLFSPVLTKGNVELNWIWVRFSEASKIGEFEPFMPS
jgi:hypothetical protein